MAGLALIVANGDSKVITTGREVKAVFEEVLEFNTVFLENLARNEIISHLNIMFQPEKYQKPGMKMVFYFVGHGTKDQIIVEDGNITIINDIFQPSSICEIPKLFFFDCCRGTDLLGSVPPQAMGRPLAKENMLVAYSTHLSHPAFSSNKDEATSGLIWSNNLKEELGRDHSIYDALQITNAKLMSKYNDEDYWKGYKAFQAPIFESSLTGGTIINLRREADQFKSKCPLPKSFSHMLKA